MAQLFSLGSKAHTTMNPFDAIEKLITEHGSAVILSQQLAFAKDQFTALERQVSEFQAKVAKLEAQLEIEHSNHKDTQKELQRIKDEHAEEVRIYHNIEFRRGKRTDGKWLPFCPKCHMPAGWTQKHGSLVGCTAGCGWVTNEMAYRLDEVCREL